MEEYSRVPIGQSKGRDHAQILAGEQVPGELETSVPNGPRVEGTSLTPEAVSHCLCN